MSDEGADESPLRGRDLSADMADQPEVLSRVLTRAADIEEAVDAVTVTPPRGILLVGSEASRFATRYGQLLLEIVTGRPAWVGEPSLARCYDVQTDLTGHLAIAVSRSGHSSDTIESLDRARRGGARCLAITNDPESPLAQVAESVIALAAGTERAAAATKTFTAELTALALVAQALGPVPWHTSDWLRVVEGVEHVLPDRTVTRELAVDTLGAELVIGLGDGLLFPAVGEACATITATTGMVTAAYTPADLRIGPGDHPRGILDVVCMATPGPCLREVVEGASWLTAHGARVWAVTDTPDRVLGAAGVVPIPAGIPEALAPIVHVVRGQQIAYDLALARHLDPDVHRGLSFTTST